MVGGSGRPTGNDGFFDAVAAHLVRSGVAVLAYDKRGAGLSGGAWQSASLESLAGDARMQILPGNVFAEAVAENGTPVSAEDQLRPLRLALEGKKVRPATQADWGTPVGALRTGPWGTAAPINVGNQKMSGGAARAFEELADEELTVKRVDPESPRVPAPVEAVPA
jgi:hypothetical protein